MTGTVPAAPRPDASAAAPAAGDARLRVMDVAIREFARAGFDATTVDAIAAAAGISRRTFFRQFRSKEDVVFADHQELLAQTAAHLDRARAAGGDPWRAVCEAAELVFRRFEDNRALSVRRYRVVNATPALREREIVTVYRYERQFTDHLSAAVPSAPPVDVVAFAAAVTSGHNYLLREMLRGNPDATLARLRAELDAIRRRMTGRPAADGRRVVVAVADGGATDDEIAAAVRARLGGGSGPDGT